MLWVPALCAKVLMYITNHTTVPRQRIQVNPHETRQVNLKTQLASIIISVLTAIQVEHPQVSIIA